MASSLPITFLWAALCLDSARNGPPSYAGGADLSYFSLHGVAAAKPRVRPLTRRLHRFSGSTGPNVTFRIDC